MNCFASVALTSMLTLAAVLCSAQTDCPPIEVRADIEVGPGNLTLSDLLPTGGCPRLYAAARRVSLGTAPLPGSLRALAGTDVRRLLDGLRDPSLVVSAARIPDRILLARAETMKSCAEVAEFLMATDPALSPAKGFDEEALNCAAAKGIPRNARLELNHTAWNSSLRRWEFALRCERVEQCVPFMVWARASQPADANAHWSAGRAEAVGVFPERRRPVVTRGETVTLTWDQAGIRVVLPVICLEAGAIGQFVLVRFQNVARTLRAEVVGAGTLRVSL